MPYGEAVTLEQKGRIHWLRLSWQARLICYTSSELINQFEEIAIKPSKTQMKNVFSAVTARTQLGQILKRAGEGGERFLVDRRGEPAVVIMSMKDYIENIATSPAAYTASRQEAKRNGTSSLSMRDIDREIAAVRKAKGKRSQPAA